MGRTGTELDFDESPRPRFDARCRSGVAAALLIVLATSASGLTRPREATQPLGTDSDGAGWQVRVAVDEPLVVFGPRRFSVQTKEPLDLDIHTTIDRRNTAWIVDHQGRGVQVQLADGKAQEFRVPVTVQLIGGIAVADGQMYFADRAGRANSAVRRMDVASGETKTLLTLEAGWTVYTMLSGQRRLWIAAWNGLAVSRHAVELIALDWATGNVALQARREMPWATLRWSTFEVVEAQDGAAWVANGYTGRVERLDESGAWQGWPLDGRTPSNLVAARFGAACLLQQLQPPSEPQFSGAPIQAPTVLRRELAAFQPGTPTVVTHPVATHVGLSADRAGGVRVEGIGHLALDGGQLLIVPAPGSATELPKPPS